MRALVVVFLLVLVGMGAFAAWVVSTWGIMGALALVGGLVVLGLLLVVMGRRLLGYVFKLPFMMKGKAMKGGSIEIHDLRPSSRPTRPRASAEEGEEQGDEEEEEALDEEEASLRWYVAEVTVHPNPAPEQFQHWEPGELLITPADHVIGPDGEVGEIGGIEQVEVWSNGAWVVDEEYKHQGARRLRLTLHVKPGPSQVRWLYYFEPLNTFTLP